MNTSNFHLTESIRNKARGGKLGDVGVQKKRKQISALGLLRVGMREGTFDGGFEG